MLLVAEWYSNYICMSVCSGVAWGYVRNNNPFLNLQRSDGLFEELVTRCLFLVYSGGCLIHTAFREVGLPRWLHEILEFNLGECTRHRIQFRFFRWFLIFSVITKSETLCRQSPRFGSHVMLYIQSAGKFFPSSSNQYIVFKISTFATACLSLTTVEEILINFSMGATPTSYFIIYHNRRLQHGGWAHVWGAAALASFNKQPWNYVW